ncbi:hypothetical protein [Lysinibacillus sp. 54212]|uniref:hypothetical protein n=1 Tax=Lysinibacillus sp. 54212 TaxID=3119829 RepID=UPI002FCBCDDB
MTEGDVKRIIVEMITKGEIKFFTSGNPNARCQTLNIEFDINEDDYRFNEIIDLVDI